MTTSAQAPVRNSKAVRGRFDWHELMTTDPEAAKQFYTAVIGWNTQDWAGSLYSRVSDELLASLRKAGMTIIEPNEEPFRKAVEPVYAKHAEKFGPLLQAIRDTK